MKERELDGPQQEVHHQKKAARKDGEGGPITQLQRKSTAPTPVAGNQWWASYFYKVTTLLYFRYW
jgi:hypothetical protein